jgi:hypothetical protein
MRACSCGEKMVPSTRRIRVFGAVDETPLRVPADECRICGRMVPSDGAVEHALGDPGAERFAAAR